VTQFVEAISNLGYGVAEEKESLSKLEVADIIRKRFKGAERYVGGKVSE
jgi:hypothetical protein